MDNSVTYSDVSNIKFGVTSDLKGICLLWNYLKRAMLDINGSTLKKGSRIVRDRLSHHCQNNIRWFSVMAASTLRPRLYYRGRDNANLSPMTSFGKGLLREAETKRDSSNQLKSN
jgi:hypothetical protein